MCLYLLAYACAVSCDRWTSTVDNADMPAVCKLLRGSGRTAEQLTGLTVQVTRNCDKFKVTFHGQWGYLCFFLTLYVHLLAVRI